MDIFVSIIRGNTHDLSKEAFEKILKNDSSIDMLITEINPVIPLSMNQIHMIRRCHTEATVDRV